MNMKIIVFINSYYIDVPKAHLFLLFASSILELDDSFPGRMGIRLFPIIHIHGKHRENGICFHMYAKLKI